MPAKADSARRAVIVVSSHVVRGSVGNRAAVFALETLGFPVWAVPTVILPWHPGHGPATRIVPPAAEFAALLKDLEAAPWLGEVGAVLSGYLGDGGQAAAVASLVRALKARNRDALYLCDPVIGDENGLYVAEATAAAIRDLLLPLADIATPNRFELEWLTGKKIADNGAAVAAAAACGPAAMLVTSSHAASAGHTANLLVGGGRALLAEHAAVERPPNGPGDLTAALFLARRLSGLPDAEALRLTSAAVCEILARATARGADELMLETDAASLSDPQAFVRLGDPRAGDGRDAGPDRPVAGVDGCKGGWVAAIRHRRAALPEVRVFSSFGELVEALPADAVIAVDMPIGLPDRIGQGGRGPEQAVRPLLGERQSSVFSIPARAAVEAADYGESCRLALASSEPPRKVSRQAFALFPKILEIDRLLASQPALQERLIEVHPELAFRALDGGAAMRLPKKVKGRINEPGMDERIALLERRGIAPGFLRGKLPPRVGRDDLLDATAAMLVAERFAAGLARPYPDPPLFDSHGIRVAIWA